MSFTLGIIFILCSNAILYNVPASQGRAVQGYKLRTLSQVMTPLETLTYIVFGTWPSRVTYSRANRAYVVRGQGGHFRNDLKKKRGQQQQKYKLMPRWEYILRQMVPNVGLPFGYPMELMRDGLSNIPLLSGLLGQGNGGDEDDDGVDDADGTDDDGDGADGEGDGDGDGGDGDGQDKPKKDNNGGYKFPSFPTMPSLPSMPTSFPSLWNNGNNPSGNKDDKTDGNDYKQAMKDVLQSDLTKSLAKTGVSMLPGGQAALTAFDIGSKIADGVNKNKDGGGKDKGGDDVMDELVQDAISSEVGQAAIKGLVGLLPGGDKIVKAMETGDKMEDATKKIPKL